MCIWVVCGGLYVCVMCVEGCVGGGVGVGVSIFSVFFYAHKLELGKFCVMHMVFVRTTTWIRSLTTSNI